MTSTQFDNGYCYATELKDFAETIGIQRASCAKMSSNGEEVPVVASEAIGS
jgi:hypothetical protein